MELTRQALPGMIARRRGHIVNISSLSGVVSLPGYASYGASKAGLTHFTSCLNADLRGIKGVGVTVAEVGPVRSALLDSVTSADTIRRSYDRLYKTGMVRDLDPEDVAHGVVQAVQEGQARRLAAEDGGPRAGGGRAAPAGGRRDHGRDPTPHAARLATVPTSDGRYSSPT